MFINKLTRSNTNVSNDSEDSTLHSHNYMLEYVDSGIATSNDVHSVVFDDHPITPPPTIVIDNQKIENPHVCSILNGTFEIKKTPGPQSHSHFSVNSNISTIRQHYYPEAGWGFVILIIGVIVQVLTHGIQMCSGIFLLKTKNVFNVDDITELGMWLYILIYPNRDQAAPLLFSCFLTFLLLVLIAYEYSEIKGLT